MKTLQTPQDTDWDRFWSVEKAPDPAKISWSKRRILQVLERRVEPGKFVLDAGCGSGFFSKYFCDRGMRTTALDFSENALDRAAKVTKGAAKLVRADMVSDPLAEKLFGKVDLIFSDGLLEHFSPEEQDAIMQNFRSVLTDGGLVVTVVPNRWSPWELIRPFFMPGIDEKPFVLEQLLDLNRRNGLAVLESGGINVLPFSVSPEFLGPRFGMLLYTIAKNISSVQRPASSV